MLNDSIIFKDKIFKVLKEILPENVSIGILKDNTDLINEVGLNSLGFLQFIIQLENEFDIEIDIEKLDLKYFNKLSLLEVFINDAITKSHG